MTLCIIEAGNVNSRAGALHILAGTEDPCLPSRFVCIAMRLTFLICMLLMAAIPSRSQCAGGISLFPYEEDFETSDGGWAAGGSGNDWAWGSPVKTVITGAGSGTRCWITGGLTSGAYTNGEASWIQSPCFDFSNIQYPFISFRVNWDTEQQFDGANLQFSLDNGASWETVGIINDPVHCLNENWYNTTAVTYLSPLTSSRQGWSGNNRSVGGSCRGGGGSNGWQLAKHTMPYLGGRPAVLFRFTFGAGTICNNYDGFAVDDIRIGEAPPNSASFLYNCTGPRTVNFTNTSAACPQNIQWDFGDPASGTANNSTAANPVHTFSGPGSYTVSLRVSGPDNATATITRDIHIPDLSIQQITPVDCQSGTGGSLEARPGISTVPLQYSWNTSPVQTTALATGLKEGIYTVSVSGTDACPATAAARAEKELSCQGIYFPAAFTPDRNGKNDGFGPLGSIYSLENFTLSIYNRWGERIFYSTDPLKKWDGTVRAVRTDGNLFIWQSSFSLPGQPVERRKGTVLLIR